MESRIKEIFAEVFNVELSTITNELAYQQIPEWDSVAHMSLIAALEDEYDIMIDTDDVIDMSSVAKAIEIVQKYQ